MLIWVDTKKVLFLCDDAQEVIIFISVKKDMHFNAETLSFYQQ